MRRAGQLSATLREPSPEDMLASMAASEEFDAYRQEPEFASVVAELEAERSVNAAGL